MIKNECKIVRDLFPNYIENEVSNETKEFVDEHLKNCKKCSEILRDINKSDIKHEIDKSEDEIDFLKKYNEKIVIAKSIIIVLLIVILSSIGIVTFKYTSKYVRGMRAHDIIVEVYNKTEEFKKQNNLVLEVDTSGRKSTYSYKDGYLKEEIDYKGVSVGPTDEQGDFNGRGEMKYGRIINFKDDYFTVDKYVGVYWNYDVNHNPVKDSVNTTFRQEISYTNEFAIVNTIYNREIMDCSNIKVTEDNGWYILEEYSGKEKEKEMYISKSDMLLKKCITCIDGWFSTTTFNYTTGTLKDEDVRLTEIEKSEIEKYQHEQSKKSRPNREVWRVYMK